MVQSLSETRANTVSHLVHAAGLAAGLCHVFRTHLACMLIELLVATDLIQQLARSRAWIVEAPKVSIGRQLVTRRVVQ